MKKETKIRNSFVNGAISPESIAKSIASHSTKKQIGGHAIFLGQVRADEIAGKQVKAIEFTAYKEMAEQKIAEIREAIFARYDLICMHVYHSVGTVKTGEICFFVFTSSAHRKPAQLACEELVERFKSEVQVWGKEILEDNSYQWKENKIERNG